jgi:hypothetical protein
MKQKTIATNMNNKFFNISVTLHIFLNHFVNLNESESINRKIVYIWKQPNYK